MLFISDGIIDDNTILEIKSAYSAKDCASIQKAIHTGKVKSTNFIL